MNVSLPQSFGERLALHARERPEHIAVRCDEQALTYGSLGLQAARLGNALLRLGFVPGRAPRVAILAANSLQYSVTIAACYAYGFCLVPIASLIAPDAQARMLIDADVGVLFVSAQVEGKATEALAIASASGRRITAIALDAAYMPWPAFGDVLAAEAPVFDGGFARPEWEANLIYSSGTTGTPKGVMHTHRARGVQFENIRAFGFSSDTELIDPVNLYSNFGVSGLTATLFWGGTTLMMSRFSVAGMTNFYRRHNPTVAWVVPAVLLRVLADPDFVSAAGSGATLKVCSGAPLSTAQKQECLSKWPGRLIEAYGQTETGIATALDVGDAPTCKQGSVGRAIPNCSVVIIGGDGQPLEANTIGEVALNTPDLMSDYHGSARGNPRIFWHDSSGRRFKLTGDLGRLDADGYLWLSGRSGETIISGGYNVYAVDIEEVLSRHPAVLEAAVVGAPSLKWGETPVACVELREGARAQAEDLRRWANARLGEVQRLAGVELYGELPRGTMGKILKRRLREELAARGDDYQAPP